jgi:predicted nucleotidyltransferase
MELKFRNQDKLIKLFKALYPNCKIYLFGSRARGTHKSNSDVDLAIDTGLGERLNFLDYALLSNIIETLNIPQKVDLVDLNSTIPESFKENILKEGVLLCLD